ncbi:MAG: hypothetical protein ACJARI_003045 [Bacteroidia bacterium]|jgi:hypothetical protein
MPGSVYENIADRITGEGIWVYGLVPIAFKSVTNAIPDSPGTALCG